MNEFLIDPCLLRPYNLFINGLDTCCRLHNILFGDIRICNVRRKSALIAFSFVLNIDSVLVAFLVQRSGQFVEFLVASGSDRTWRRNKFFGAVTLKHKTIIIVIDVIAINVMVAIDIIIILLLLLVLTAAFAIIVVITANLCCTALIV